MWDRHCGRRATLSPQRPVASGKSGLVEGTCLRGEETHFLIHFWLGCDHSSSISSGSTKLLKILLRRTALVSLLPLPSWAAARSARWRHRVRSERAITPWR